MKEKRKIFKIKNKDCLKNRKGITLVALIITIIIILILSGIIISNVVDEDGIIQKTEQASNENTYKALIEQIQVQCEYIEKGEDVGKVDLIKTKENIENLNNDKIDFVNLISKDNQNKIVVNFTDGNKYEIAGSTEKIQSEEDLDTYFIFDTSGEEAKLTGLTESGKALEQIKVPKMVDGKRVTTIANSCFMKSEAKLIIIPETVTKIEKNIFVNALVESIIIEGNNLKTIDLGAFGMATKLKYVNIPDSVESIGDKAFAYCSNLLEIKLPKSMKKIEKSVFSGCTKLKEIVISDGIEIIDGSAFLNTNSLEKISINGENKNFVVKDNILFSKDMTQLVLYPRVTNVTEYEIPSTVNTVCAYAFLQVENLNKIIIPDSVTTVELSAFQGCKQLKEVIISNNLKIIPNRGFAQCTSLTKITLPTSVTTIDYAAFYQCTALKNISIPSSVEQVNGEAFSLCTDLLIKVDRTESDCNAYVSGWNAGNTVEYKQ